MSIFARKNNKPNNNLDNYPQLALQMYNIGNFDHEKHYSDFVSDNQANLFNGKTKYEISQSEIVEKLENYLDKSNFTNKNWILEKELSKQGVYAYLVFAYKNKLQFQPVKITSPIYDVDNTLLEVNIGYESYIKNGSSFQMFEKYQLLGKTVKITRWVEALLSHTKSTDFKKDVLNNLLEEEQILNIDQIPVAIMRNLPSERSDLQGVTNKIKALDIFFDQIILDVVLNSTRFLVNSNGMIGNRQEMVNEAIKQFLQNNILIIDYDPETDPLPINTINGEFHGKALCEMYDWLVNEINKRAGVHIPSLIKEAQQTIEEVRSVNTPVINMIEQKIKQRENDRANFIKLLLKFDKKIMSGNNFSANDIDNLDIKVNINLLNPGINQITDEKENKEEYKNATKKNPISA